MIVQLDTDSGRKFCRVYGDYNYYTNGDILDFKGGCWTLKQAIEEKGCKVLAPSCLTTWKDEEA